MKLALCFIKRDSNVFYRERLTICCTQRGYSSVLIERRLFLHLPLTVVTWRVGVKHNRWRFAHWCEYVHLCDFEGLHFGALPIGAKILKTS